jgi:tetratricopeptide (TPR) repeat protein
MPLYAVIGRPKDTAFPRCQVLSADAPGRIAMREMWRALGPVAQDSKWIVPVLGIAASVATFALAGPVVGLCFVVALMAMFLFVAFRYIAKSTETNIRASGGDEPQQSSAGIAGSADVSTQRGTSETATAGANGQPSVASSVAASTDETEIDGAPEEDALDRSAVEAAFRGDLAAVRAASEKALASLSDEAERNRTSAFYNFLLVKAGDSDALAKLQELVNARAQPPDRVLFAYASALDVLGESDQAIQTLLSASERFSADQRAEAILQAAQIHRRLNNNSGAIDLLFPVADDEQVTSAHRAQAWAQLARCKADVSPLEAMAAYEKAVQLDPSNADVRFSLAYLYGDHNLATLAHYHYSVLEESNAATSIALNNLAVTEEQLGMRGRAIAHYQVAAEGGAALACANLAHNLLSAGHVVEARQWIQRGELLDANQPRLISARERLSEIVETEDEVLTSTQLAAVSLRASVASVQSADGSAPRLVEGPWRLSNGVLVTFNATDAGYEGVDDSKGWRIRLTRCGSVFLTAVRPNAYAGEVEGFMHLSTSEEMAFILRDASHSKVPSSLTAVREVAVSDEAGTPAAPG